MSDLLIISSATVHIDGDDLFLDVKFVEGMRLYAELWPGPVGCVLNVGDQPPFSRRYKRDELPFTVTLIEPSDRMEVRHISDYSVVMCSGDADQFLHLPRLCDLSGAILVYVIEYTIATRVKILLLDEKRKFPIKVYSIVIALCNELRRLKAFALSDGLQANGFPAHDAYAKINQNTILYLDSRLRENSVITECDLERRIDRVMGDAPLRLAHSGRLEPMKGSYDLIALALELRTLGVPFTLDIFGCGSQEDQIIRDVNRYSLQRAVRVRHKVDFEEELVPFLRDNCDVYISCHRQSDPSCTYLESMGLGLAVIGYANQMWSALCLASDAGWVVPMADTKALAGAVAVAAQNRADLACRMRAARRFSSEHFFESEFSKRVLHLAEIFNSRERSEIKMRDIR